MSHLRRFNAILFSLAVGVLPVAAKAADTAMLLEVDINDHANGKIGEFMLRDGLLYSKSKELLAL